MKRHLVGLTGLLLAGCTWSNSLYQAHSLSGEAARAERGGRPSEAQGLWNQAGVKAESALARSPRGKRGAEARWLLGRALARGHDCGRGRAYLENSLADVPDAKWREALELELARCVELVDTVRAATLFASLAGSRDVATRLEAREGAGRDLVATGQPEAALAILAGVASPAGRLDRAVALALLGRADSSFAEVRLLLETPGAPSNWEPLLEALAGNPTDAADRLVVFLTTNTELAPLQLNNWRLAALRGTRPNDTSAFRRRLTLLLSGKPGTALNRGRLLAAERAVTRVASVAALVTLRDSLAQLPALAGDFLVARQWTHLTSLVGSLADQASGTSNGAAQGDLLTFALAEIARDSLHAPQLATELFAKVESGWPASPYVPKSMLARIWLQPDSAQALRERVATHSDSPYLAYLRGLDDSTYRRLEDSLGRFVRAFAAKAAKDSPAGVIR